MRYLIALGLLASGCRKSDPDPSTATVDTSTPTSTPGDVFEDINDDPHIFEANLRARLETFTIEGEPVEMFTYAGRVPGPQIRVVQGDQVIVHLINELPDDFPTTIHWHGIEGTNAMDGTPVTQAPIPSGEVFTYDFVAPRPGIYWYHPHIRGAQTVFNGMYAPLIVDDPDDQTLTDMGILPDTRHTLMLSDVSAYDGNVLSVEVDNPMEIMNGTEGKVLLVNGQQNPTLEVPAGDGVRLQVINASITRFWRLSVPGHTLYRVGGEGGLLDTVRVEGGTVEGTTYDASGAVMGVTPVDTRFDEGEVVLGPAERADLVLVPNGSVGDTVELRWEDFRRGRHGMWMEGDTMVMGDATDDGTRAGSVVATFQLVQGQGSDFAIAEGDPILEAVGRAVERLDPAGAIDWTGPDNWTELQGRMDMWLDEDDIWQMETHFSIDDVTWHPEMMGGPSQILPDSHKRARLGDTVMWEIKNNTSMAHPWHLHGFSYQPLEFVFYAHEMVHTHPNTTIPDVDTFVHYPFEASEFEDTTLIPPHTALRYLVRIDDPNGNQGSVGRWLKHCHIFQHGGNGMMSELVIDP